MRRRYIQQVSLDEPVVNLTPLIDVVFVILIMFIVVAPLLEMDKIELASASSQLHDVHSIQETSPIAIHVRKDNAILYNGDTVNIDQLLFRLQQARQLHPTAHPQVFHDREAHFGTYQQVKNAAEAAGFPELDIVLRPS